MTRENFRTKIFYSKIGRHVLTPFSDTCLADDEVRKITNGSNLADVMSQPMEGELALMVYVSKLSCGVRVVC
jgi:hypothetical protein